MIFWMWKRLALSCILFLPLSSSQTDRQVGMVFLQDKIPGSVYAEIVIAKKPAFNMMTCSLICLQRRGCIVGLFVIADENCILLWSYLKTLKPYRPTDDENDQTKMVVLSAYDPCDPHPCHKSGICIRQESGYECACPNNRLGRRCNIKVSGKSCLDMKEKFPGKKLKNGYYSIISGTKRLFMAYCDMTTDGGGWMQVANIVLDKDGNENVQFNEYSTLKNANTSVNYAFASSALKELMSMGDFTSIRFNCKAGKPVKTLHLKINSKAAVNYYTGRSDSHVFNCNDLTRLDGDNSNLTRLCSSWKFSPHASRLLDHSFYIERYLHWVVSKTNRRYECDNEKQSEAFSGDFWRVYIK